MESDLQKHHHHLLHDRQHQHRQQQMNSGLTRYRSAPSSYFSSFIDNEICEEFLHPRPSSPETERILARFISGTSGANTEDTSTNNFRQNSPPNEVVNRQSQFMGSMKSEEIHQQQNYYQSSRHPPLPNQNTSSAMDYRMVTSMEMNRLPRMKMGGGSNSNLIRQNSSPAGLFSHLNVESGYAAMRGMGNYGAGNTANGEASFPSASRLKNQMNFSSGSPSSSKHMATIPESGNKSSPESGGLDEGRSNNYITGFPVGSWDDSVIMSENITGMKRFREDDAAEIQNVEAGNGAPRMLAHHLSLPKTSAEMSAIENYLQLQDSVPCKIRAKRGCATHPRSIAERVRRTRISERMRKLQELVPNMDKQTNTADMLDLAVDYIKDLQRQVKTISDNRAKCTCSNRQQL